MIIEVVAQLTRQKAHATHQNRSPELTLKHLYLYPPQQGVRRNLSTSRVRQAVPPVEHVYYEQPLQGVRAHNGHVHQLLRGALRCGRKDTIHT